MVGSTMTSVLVCFKMDRVLMEMWGPTQVKEVFVQGMDKLGLFVTMEKPTIEKVEALPKLLGAIFQRKDYQSHERSPMMINAEMRLE